MAFDRQSGRVVMVERRASGSITWTFDVCTSTWQRMLPATEPGVLSIVYDVDSDLTVGLDPEGTAWAYDVGSNRWTDRGSVPLIHLVAYDPVSGLVVGWEAIERMWAYDVETGEATPVPQGDVIPPQIGTKLVAYEVSSDRFVLYFRRGAERATTWLFDPREGSWVEERVEAPVMEFMWGDLVSGGEIVYDEAADMTVILSDGIAIAHEPAAEGWERLNLDPNLPHSSLSGFRHSLVYDALNGRVLVYGGRARTQGPPWWEAMYDVIELRPAEGTWRVISIAA
jgi:hypothetical protein